MFAMVCSSFRRFHTLYFILYVYTLDVCHGLQLVQAISYFVLYTLCLHPGCLPWFAARSGDFILCTLYFMYIPCMFAMVCSSFRRFHTLYFILYVYTLYVCHGLQLVQAI